MLKMLDGLLAPYKAALEKNILSCALTTGVTGALGLKILSWIG